MKLKNEDVHAWIKEGHSPIILTVKVIEKFMLYIDCLSYLNCYIKT